MAKIFNRTKASVVSSQAGVADSALSRAKGLLGRKILGEEESLVITRCKSIHMVFMKFAIDAVFVDKNGCVVGLVANIRPFRFSPVFWNSNFVVELPAGAIAKHKISMGDHLEILP